MPYDRLNVEMRIHSLIVLFVHDRAVAAVWLLGMAFIAIRLAFILRKGRCISQMKSVLEQHDELLVKTRDFTLMNNVFMAVALDDKWACQHVVRVLSGNQNLTVVSVKTEYRISKLVVHDAVLDVLAEDENGMLHNLEIQRPDTVDHARRTRFYGAMIDSEMLEKGKMYKELPEIHIIYISEKDLWEAGKTCYPVVKFLTVRRFPMTTACMYCM